MNLFDQLSADAPPKKTRIPFQPAKAKFTIGSVDNPGLDVSAQYNPKDVQVTQPFGWAVHQPAKSATASDLVYEFTGMQSQTLQVELLFDFEGSDDTVMERIADLKELASVRDPDSKDPKRCRPHLCVVTWGTGDFPRLRCVIESIATKYTMFTAGGDVMRATCTVSLKEANLVRLSANEEAARAKREREDR